MKNTSVKIVILVASILIAVGAILAFWKIFVEPPHGFEPVNLHISSIKADIAKITARESRQYNDSLYVLIDDKIKVFHDNGYISDAETDLEIGSFARIFVATYSDLCEKKFNSPNWGSNGFKEIQTRIKELKGLKFTSGYIAVGGSDLGKLQDIEGVIGRYKRATEAASVTSYNGVERARSAINTANSFLNDSKISKSDLHDKLVKVKTSIGNSHYSYLENKVNVLRNYRDMSKEEFEAMNKSLLDEEFNSYESVKSIYGSASKDLGSLRSVLSSLWTEAHEYYESLVAPVVTYSTGGWTYTDSPSSDYKAFMSSSNLGEPNSTSSMSFTIKGYDTFTFYIRSDAEEGYDYVIVGQLNQQPSVNSSNSIYASTRDRAQSGSSFYNYKAVTYNGLDRSREYRVFVVYKKDGSNNNGSDRGYLLLPSIATYSY